MSEIRSVCIVVASRANYGRVKYLSKAIEEHPQLKLQLVLGASAVLERFGSTRHVIEADGFKVDRSIHYMLEGETLDTQAKSTGLGVVELATTFSDLKPDAVVTVADRFETMATAIASTYLNIPLLHIQGGEVSGNIDDRVRHAITKLSDFHFVSSADAERRVLAMGEERFRVFNVGCPSMDILANNDLSMEHCQLDTVAGVGDKIDWAKPFILMSQHPVTTSYGQASKQVEETLVALSRFPSIQKIVLWPNNDAGSDELSKAIRKFREAGRAENFRFFKSFSPEHYGIILNAAVCCVGNSSSFIRECAFLGVPSVVVGDRQKNRQKGVNVVNVEYKADEIERAIIKQMSHGRYKPDHIFGDGFSGQKIASIIPTLDLDVQKMMAY